MGKEAAREVGASLRRFLRRLEEAFAPTQVVLFGSRARGDSLVHSDVDVVVVSEAFEGMAWRERLRRVLELWDGEVPLEPLCYTPEEFRERSQEISVVREAVREGRVLVSR